MTSLRFCLVLHNHQPVGNFGGVFEQAYQDSYLPFLDVFEPYSELRLSLHTSGPLMEWLDQNHPEYLDRIANLTAAGRIEILGGPFYEPILTMIPSRDRVGQITQYTQWLESRLGGQVQGMWMPERVWEQNLTKDLAHAGMKYTVLDDFHFRNAGLTDDQLFGYYLTEEDGSLLSVFPGSEQLRYYIPFADPQQTIDYLGRIHQAAPGSVVVFGDDGEKFGTWPETKTHVYQNGWLRRFLDALSANRSWLNACTLADAVENVAPVGKVYIPDASYREMTEWALPVERQMEYDHVVHEMEHHPSWPSLKRFVRGGFWRNFKVKYAEANEMYSRMMHVSRRLEKAEKDLPASEPLKYAQQALYRGQCNCPYWHGAFGGIYLPHLRNAVYNQLIAADNLLDSAQNRGTQWVEAVADDFNFDMRQEIRFANDKLIGWIAPSRGGMLYELDVRTICLNLLATLMRRPEAYHKKILAGASHNNSSAASIHDRVVFKQPGLDQRLQYDSHPRKSLIDHFYDANTTLDAVARGEAQERGDFVDGAYDARIRRSADRVQVLLSREGMVGQYPIKVTKGVSCFANQSTLEISYLVEGLPPGVSLPFAVEFNFAALPAGASDRFFQRLGGSPMGHLGTRLQLSDVQDLCLVDQWLGIRMVWTVDKPTAVWTFPIESVSQSEGGFELVHQSVAVLPHWHIMGDVDGRWAVTMRLNADTTLAQQRMMEASQAVAVG